MITEHKFQVLGRDQGKHNVLLATGETVRLDDAGLDRLRSDEEFVLAELSLREKSSSKASHSLQFKADIPATEEVAEVAEDPDGREHAESEARNTPVSEAAAEPAAEETPESTEARS